MLELSAGLLVCLQQNPHKSEKQVLLLATNTADFYPVPPRNSAVRKFKSLPVILFKQRYKIKCNLRCFTSHPQI